MTGDIGVHCGTRGHLRNIGRSRNFESYIRNFGSYICGVRRGSRDGETSSQWAIGQEQSRCGCKYTGGYGIKNDSGLGNGNSGGYGKIERDDGFGSGNAGGMESGADTEAGMDSESTADWSRAGVGAEASARCTIATGRGDVGADLRSTVAGTATGDDVALVAKVRIGPIAETIPLACAAANAWLGIAGVATEWVG